MLIHFYLIWPKTHVGFVRYMESMVSRSWSHFNLKNRNVFKMIKTWYILSWKLHFVATRLDLGLWCLMPLSTIFQSVLLMELAGENHPHVESHWQILSHNVVSSTPRPEWDLTSQLYSNLLENLKMLLIFFFCQTKGRWKCWSQRQPNDYDETDVRWRWRWNEENNN